jgi:hypothetical protein
MRLQKVGSMIGILLFVGFFVTGVAAAAPDMSQWVGKWVSYTVIGKGIEIQLDGSGVTKSSIKERNAKI